jgi:hypothetical protein
MLFTSDTNPVPKVGQLFYTEYRSEEGKFQFSSLKFIDQKPEEGKQWMYTQIAHIEDENGEMEAYGGIEAGGMPAEYTRIATDEDVSKFIDNLIKSADKGISIIEGSSNFKDWLDAVEKDEILLVEEKERIKRLVPDNHK